MEAEDMLGLDVANAEKAKEAEARMQAAEWGFQDAQFAQHLSELMDELEDTKKIIASNDKHHQGAQAQDDKPKSI